MPSDARFLIVWLAACVAMGVTFLIPLWSMLIEDRRGRHRRS